MDTHGKADIVSRMDEGKGKEQRRRRRVFTDEFEAGAVKLVLEEARTAGQVARELALTESSIRNWVVQAKVDAGKGKPGALTTAERDELSRLRKEVRELRIEREILKRAAVFFAQESK